MEAVKLLSPSDIAELGLTKGQNKLLSKAVNELRAPAQPAKLTEPITTTSLADQGLDELIKKLDNGGGLDALVSCGVLMTYRKASIQQSHQRAKRREIRLEST